MPLVWKDLVMSKTINSHRRLNSEQKEFLLLQSQGRVPKKGFLWEMWSRLFEERFYIRVSHKAMLRLLQEHQRNGSGKEREIRVGSRIYRGRPNRVSRAH